MTKRDYMARRAAILDDPAASFWLKGCMLSAGVRDPIDVLNDLEVLTDLARTRVEEIGLAAGRAA